MRFHNDETIIRDCAETIVQCDFFIIDMVRFSSVESFHSIDQLWRRMEIHLVTHNNYMVMKKYII